MKGTKIKNSGTKEFPFYQIIVDGVEYCSTNNLDKAEHLALMLSVPSEEKNVSLEEIEKFASDAFLAGRIYQNESNVNHRNFTQWFQENKGRVLSLSSNDKQEKKPLSEISDKDAIEACKLLFRHPNSEYDITPDEVAVAPFTRGEEYFKLEVVCRCFEGTVMICFNGDVQCFDEEGKLQSINPLTYYQYLQFKGYQLPVYYPERKGGDNEDK